MPSKRFLIISVLIFLILIGLGIWIGSNLSQPNPSGPSEYSAVYLSTGDIYYGILSWFPWPHLKNVWLLQRSVDQNNQPQLSIAPFSRAFWGPVDEVYLNPKQVIFWTRLRNDSQVLKAIQNPSALQQQPQAQQPASSAAPTSTFRGPSTQPPK